MNSITYLIEWFQIFLFNTNSSICRHLNDNFNIQFNITAKWFQL